MNPACQSWKPDVLTLYRLSCQNPLCQNSLWDVFKGNQSDKWQEKANQAAGFSSTCVPRSPDSILQAQADSPVTQFRGDTSPGYFSSYSLSSSCPSIFQLLLAGVDSLSAHWQGGSCRCCLLQPFRGPPSPAEPRTGTEDGHRKGSSRCAHHIPVEETHVKPLAHFRFGNRVPAVILKSVSGFMSENCKKLVPRGSWEPIQPSELILARMHIHFPCNISHVNESKWEKVWILWPRSQLTNLELFGHWYV